MLAEVVHRANMEMRGQTASMAIGMKRSGAAVAVEYEWKGTDADLLYIADILVGLVEQKRKVVMEREARQAAFSGPRDRRR